MEKQLKNHVEKLKTHPTKTQPVAAFIEHQELVESICKINLLADPVAAKSCLLCGSFNISAQARRRSLWQWQLGSIRLTVDVYLCWWQAGSR